MAGSPHPKAIKAEAKRLRKRGVSYAAITNKLGVPKSTLSTWFNHIYPVNRSKQLQHLARIRKIAAAKINQKRLDVEAKIAARVAKEMEKFPASDPNFQKSILAALYWAEGSKHERAGGPRFANSDPELALLYLTLLRNCFSIDERRIRVRVHVHSYHNKHEVTQFWSRLLDVPETQFGKIYVKKRPNSGKRHRRNFVGVCFIQYYSSNVRKELIEVARQVGALIVAQAKKV